MEACGIILAFPVAAFGSAVYSLLLVHVLSQVRFVSRMLLIGSSLVAGLAAIELGFCLSTGIVGTREALGLSFAVLHGVVLFLAAPAVANLFLLWNPVDRPHWIRVAFLMFLVAIVLLFWNIQVSEALYGVDGVGGPYGAPVTF